MTHCARQTEEPEQRKAKALDRLAPLADRLRALKAEGLTKRAIADRLDAEGVMSPAGGMWQAGNVHRAIARLATEPSQPFEW